MSTFALDPSSSTADIVDGLNYVMANLGDINNITGNGNVFAYGNIVTANTTTGELSTVDSGVVGYLNAYVNVKYANTSTGGSGFSANSQNRAYYGVDNNTTGNISSNPTDYVWFQVSGGFGTTKSLWYSTLGGSQIRFFAGNAAPDINYRSVVDNTAIALITLSNSVVQSNTVATSAITTVKMATAAATQVITQQDSTAYPLLNWVNGSDTIGTAGYKWPNYTRGIPISAPIVATTTGSADGSAITVNWNTYLFSETNNTYNLVELWRSGSETFYQKTFRTVRCTSGLGNTAPPYTIDDNFVIPGGSGALYAGNIGNIVQQLTSTSNDLYDGFAQQDETDYNNAFGASGQYVFVSPSSNLTSNIAYAVTATGGTGSAYPLFDMYGSAPIAIQAGPITKQPTVIVGSDGYIGFWTGTATNYSNGLWAFETSNTLNDLFDISADWAFNNDAATSGTVVNYVAVGAAGTILYNARTYNSTGNVATTSGWSQASSGTVTNLNAVASNPTLTINTSSPFIDTGTRGNLWVAVGNGGTILRATTGSGPWTAANSVPTTNNLQGVGYANGTWLAVGDLGTVIYSTDADTWSNVSIPAVGTRNMYGAAGGYTTGRFVIAGQEIILTANTNTVANTTWANTYIGGASLTTDLTRVQFFGSWANVANVSQPPVQQRLTNGQVISGTYTDVDYAQGDSITYYVVAGNMFGNVNVYTNSSSITVSEIKR
jgi:hypothetical protein